jgi:hypothetical protein
MLRKILFIGTSVLFMLAPISSVLAQTNPTNVPVEVRTEDSALLPIPGAVLNNNVYGKGNITNYKQSIFRGKNDAGWE